MSDDASDRWARKSAMTVAYVVVADLLVITYRYLRTGIPYRDIQLADYNTFAFYWPANPSDTACNRFLVQARNTVPVVLGRISNDMPKRILRHLWNTDKRTPRARLESGDQNATDRGRHCHDQGTGTALQTRRKRSLRPWSFRSL